MSTKLSTKHPYAAIEHRVIDSPAYADLLNSACRLLTIMARQLTKENNGHLQATLSYCGKRGIGSEYTLHDAIADLIAHGFIYRTRSHGVNKTWAKYAVTWLPIKKRDGLFLSAFVPCAWRNWQSDQKKSSQQKMQDQSSRKCNLTQGNPAESAGTSGAKSADYELVPNSTEVSAHSAHKELTRQSLGPDKPIMQRKRLIKKLPSKEVPRNLIQNEKPLIQRQQLRRRIS